MKKHMWYSILYSESDLLNIIEDDYDILYKEELVMGWEYLGGQSRICLTTELGRDICNYAITGKYTENLKQHILYRTGQATELYEENQKNKAIEQENLKIPKEGFIYIFECNNRYKIGKSKDPSERIKSVRTVSPYPVKLILQTKVNDQDKTEKMLHVMFNNKKINGEWFNLTDIDITTIQTALQKGGCLNVL